MGLNDLIYSKEENTLVKKYIVPKNVVTSCGAEGETLLLRDGLRQPVMNNRGEYCVLEEGGWVVLDFGCELQGGIELTVNRTQFRDGSKGSEDDRYGQVRIVFGESVSEAMSSIGDGNGAKNDHATRDVTVVVSNWASMRYGNTGFRFVKIEAVDCQVILGGVKGVLEYRELDYKGSFYCNDERLNRIYDVAAYTVHLNMQDYIWDGIKRDRLVWVGDLNPEIATVCAVFGHDNSVERSLDLARDSFPIDEKTGGWMSFPSYSCWWIISHRDWYRQNGNKKYLEEQKEYLYQLCRCLIGRISDDGTLDFQEQYFVEWSSCNTSYAEAGFRACLVLGLRAAAELFTVFEDDTMSQACLRGAEKVMQVVPVYDGNKQITALATLSGLCDKERGREIISTRLLEGLSTFYGYYCLEALAMADDVQSAIDVMRGYWGAMLDCGATTFWEDFDITWMENAGRIDEVVPKDKVDIHARYGKFCYQKLRHSLCHGWASGPAPFMARHILGVQILEPGCRKVRIAPKLGDLTHVNGTYPTPYGVIEVEHRVVDGQVVTHVSAPKDVEIIQE